jgi:hypothetical protein
VSELLIHHLDSLIVLLFKSLGVVLTELFQLDLDLLDTLSEDLLFVLDAINDLLAIATERFLLGLDLLIDLENIVMDLLDRLEGVFIKLDLRVIQQEGEPLHQVIVLVDQLLTLEKLEVLELLLGLDKHSGALFR